MCYPIKPKYQWQGVNAADVTKIPVGSVATPKSCVFIGPNPTNPDLSDLKLQLEIFYTEIN